MGGSFRDREHRPARRQAQGPADGVGSLREVHRMRVRPLVLLVVMLAAATAHAADVDRAAVDFKTPAEIRWVRNAAGTNELAVLFGDPSKPGPHVTRQPFEADDIR